MKEWDPVVDGLRPDTRMRLATIPRLGLYLLPKLRSEWAAATAATCLSFVAAGFGLVSAFVMAALLDLVRSGLPAPDTTGVDWRSITDLNAAGAQAMKAITLLIGRPGSVEQGITLVGAVLLLTTAITVITNVLSHWLWVWVRTRILAELQLELFEHVLSLPMSFHVRHPAGALLTRLNFDIRRIAQSLPVLFHALLRAPFLFVGSLFVMIRTSPTLTIVTMAAGAAYFAANVWFARIVRESFLRQTGSLGTMMTISQEALYAIRVIKAFGAERAEAHEMRRELRDLMREEVRGDLYAAEYPAALNQLLTAIAIIGVTVVGLRLIALGDLTQPGLVLFILASVGMLATGVIIATSLVNLFSISASGARVFELTAITSEIRDGPEVARPFARSLVFRNVSFSFDGVPVLQGVDLTVSRGEVVGLVGPSGSGKSTLADLMLRLYDPKEGVIELDGTDIRRFTQSSYRRLFGVVPQETLLFHDTVRANIAYGRNVGEEEVIEAARVAQAHDFISALPSGYDTVIGERGTRLSGGERQRVALARALVARPQILVFDEATSSLDTESERLVQRAIEHAVVGRTALVIAHRISTVQNADRIVVLDNGRVVEMGRHHELVAHGGLYARLHGTVS